MYVLKEEKKKRMKEREEQELVLLFRTVSGTTCDIVLWISVTPLSFYTVLFVFLFFFFSLYSVDSTIQIPSGMTARIQRCTTTALLLA